MQNQTQWQPQKDQVAWKDRSAAVRFLRDKAQRSEGKPKGTEELWKCKHSRKTSLGENSWLERASSDRHRMALHRYDNAMEWIREWEDNKSRASVARRRLRPPVPLPCWKSRVIDLLSHLCVWQPQLGSQSLLDSRRAAGSAASWCFKRPMWWSRLRQRTFLPPDLEMRIYAPLPAACHPSSLSVAL